MKRKQSVSFEFAHSGGRSVDFQQLGKGCFPQHDFLDF